MTSAASCREGAGRGRQGTRRRRGMSGQTFTRRAPTRRRITRCYRRSAGAPPTGRRHNEYPSSGDASDHTAFPTTGCLTRAGRLALAIIASSRRLQGERDTRPIVLERIQPRSGPSRYFRKRPSRPRRARRTATCPGSPDTSRPASSPPKHAARSCTSKGGKVGRAWSIPRRQSEAALLHVLYAAAAWTYVCRRGVTSKFAYCVKGDVHPQHVRTVPPSRRWSSTTNSESRLASPVVWFVRCSGIATSVFTHAPSGLPCFSAMFTCSTGSANL